MSKNNNKGVESGKAQMLNMQQPVTHNSKMSVKVGRKWGVLAAVIVVMVTTTILMFSSHSEQPTQATQPETKTSSAVEKPYLDYINEIRAAHSLPALRDDPGLDKTAELKAEDMAARNYWDHTTPDGAPFYVLIEQNRKELKSYGENLAECFTTHEATVDAWEKSPEHLENILRPNFDLFGSASVYDQDQHCTITVNHFGEE